MQRVKKAKKKGHSREFRDALKQATYESVEYLTTMTEVILRDDFKFSNAEINKFKESMNLYSSHVAHGYVTYKDVKDIIKDKSEHSQTATYTKQGNVYICSGCGRKSVIKENFCPTCGQRWMD